MGDRLKEYLDNAIINWREKRDNAETEKESLIASCYVDAFQSVRVSILGELLEKNKGDKNE